MVRLIGLGVTVCELIEVSKKLLAEQYRNLVFLRDDVLRK